MHTYYAARLARFLFDSDNMFKKFTIETVWIIKACSSTAVYFTRPSWRTRKNIQPYYMLSLKLNIFIDL